MDKKVVAGIAGLALAGTMFYLVFSNAPSEDIAGRLSNVRSAPVRSGMSVRQVEVMPRSSSNRFVNGRTAVRSINSLSNDWQVYNEEGGAHQGGESVGECEDGCAEEQDDCLGEPGDPNANGATVPGVNACGSVYTACMEENCN